MLIGLHDTEMERIKGKTFPNYALMKISAWHKAQDDNVEWWNPLKAYDWVYSSKVFDFTPQISYLPENTTRGGTGYADVPIWQQLPNEIDNMQPDCQCYIYSGSWRQETWPEYCKKRNIKFGM